MGYFSQSGNVRPFQQPFQEFPVPQTLRRRLSVRPCETSEAKVFRRQAARPGESLCQLCRIHDPTTQGTIWETCAYCGVSESPKLRTDLQREDCRKSSQVWANLLTIARTTSQLRWGNVECQRGNNLSSLIPALALTNSQNCTTSSYQNMSDLVCLLLQTLPRPRLANLISAVIISPCSTSAVQRENHGLVVNY